MKTETEIALEKQNALLRAALESARPIVKHRAVDGSEEAAAVLDEIAEALGFPLP